MGTNCLIKPARKSVNALLKKVSEVLGRNKAATQAQVILLLNPIIRGWAMYHRHVVAAATFIQVDHLVWSKVWRWAKRRHPGKCAQWIKARYFQRKGLRDWVFTCSASGAEQGNGVELFRASNTAHKAPHEGSQRCQPVRSRMD